MIICKEIRKVNNGYIVEVRWPYGDSPLGCGEAVCKTFDEVIELLCDAACEKRYEAIKEKQKEREEMMIICNEIRKVNGGYIIEARWPYGDRDYVCDATVCETFDEVVELLCNAACGKTCARCGKEHVGGC